MRTRTSFLPARYDNRTRFLAIVGRAKQLGRFRIGAYLNASGEYSNRDDCYFIPGSSRITSDGNVTFQVFARDPENAERFKMRTVRVDRIEKMNGFYLRGVGKRFKTNRTNKLNKISIPSF